MRFFVSSSVGCFSYLFTYICRFFSSHWTSLKIKRRSKGGVQSCWGSHGWTPTKMSETCGQLSSTKWSTGNTKVPEYHKFDNVWLVSPCYWYFPIFLLHALVASHFNFVSFPSFSVPVFVAHRLSSLFPSLVVLRFCYLHLSHSMNHNITRSVKRPLGKTRPIVQ